MGKSKKINNGKTGKKNSFDPSQLKKNNKISNIIWYDDLSDDKKNSNDLFNMNFFIEKVKSKYQEMDNIFEEDLRIDKYVNYRIIGVSTANTNLNGNIGQMGYIFLISDDSYRFLYISLGYILPSFWYKYKSRKHFYKTFGDLYDLYNPTNFDFDFEVARGFMGTESMLNISIDDVENHFILHSYSEILLWGSKWKDYPFRKIYEEQNVTSKESCVLAAQAMKQLNDKVYHINTRTLYSKSIITIEDYDGAFIINVQYKPFPFHGLTMMNKRLGRYYPNDLPIDVLLTIINFPFVTHIGLLELDPLTTHNFLMSSLVANCKEMYQELIPKIDHILDNNKDEEVLEAAEMFRKNIINNTLLEDVLLDNDISQYIDQKIKSIDSNNDEEVKIAREDILFKIEGKLKEVNQDNQEARTYINTMLNQYFTLI